MKTVLVVFGGRSAEHDVSVITAHIPIMEALKASGQYEAIPLYIAKNGGWYSHPDLAKLDTYRRPDFADWLAGLKPVQIQPGPRLRVVWPGLRPRQIDIDVVFPAMHGTYGEDGSLMGLLRLANVPFVGCDMEAAVIAMDKILTQTVLRAADLPTVKHVSFSETDWQTNPEPLRAQIAKLTYPLFVKPPHLGSSIGITKVEQPAQLDDAIAVALHYDDAVIVEEGVPNLIEVTLPIMGNDDLRLALVERSLVGFFDFEEKYLKAGGKKQAGGANRAYSELPAKIAPELLERVQDLGRAAYRAIGASGIARVDFLIDSAAGQVYVNEINPLPGSLYHHNWRAAGVSAVELVTELIRLAEERHDRQAQRTFVFQSDVISFVSGPKLGG